MASELDDSGSVVLGEAEREVFRWDEFGEAARDLAVDVVASGFEPDVVVAIARGGLLLAGAVAYALGTKSCGALNVEFYQLPVVGTPASDRIQLTQKRSHGRTS